jgi:hypothetical protein
MITAMRFTKTELCGIFEIVISVTKTAVSSCSVLAISSVSFRTSNGSNTLNAIARGTYVRGTIYDGEPLIFDRLFGWLSPKKNRFPCEKKKENRSGYKLLCSVDVRVLNTLNTYRHLQRESTRDLCLCIKLASMAPRQTEPEHHKVNPPYEKKKTRD